MKQRLRSLRRRIETTLAAPRLIALAQPDRMFLTLAIPFGILFLFLLAPFQAPDEHSHFYRAYTISTGQWFASEYVLPVSVLDFSQTVSRDLAGNDQNRQSKRALLFEFSRPFQEQPVASITLLNSAIVSPLPYLPQAAGIALGRLARLNPIYFLYLGRIANFLVWLGLTTLAIRVTPLHPRLFVALALMPMALQQAASLSPDAMTIALVFLFTAQALRLTFDRRPAIAWKDWGVLAALMLGAALCKSVYVLAGGLLLLPVLRRWREQRAVIPLTLGVVGLGLAAGLLWMQYIGTFISEDMMNELHTPSTWGLRFALTHPLAVAPLFWETALQQIGFQMQMFVGNLGWIDTPLPAWVYPLYYLLLLGAVICEPHPQAALLAYERVWIAALALANSLLMLTLFFYPDGTPLGKIDLIQGRYYIPLGTLYLLPFSQRRWALSEQSPLWVMAGLLHALVLLTAARMLLWRYYSI